MTIKETITGGIKDAMKAKDQIRLRTLRGLKAAIMVAETAEGAGDVDDAQVLKIIAKQAKQRKDAAQQFTDNDREDLASKELEELEVIDTFLPKQMSEGEIKTVVEAIIAETGADSMKDMGKVMGLASQKMAGKADGKVISGIVRGLLG